MTGSAPPRIFVSYARSDGRQAAADLRGRLKEHGFPLWQDLADMEGGKDWWQQITAAIDRVEYLLLVMTPAALASPMVRREWRYARQQGTCVIPLFGATGLDLGTLPGWMSRAHFVDPAEPDQWRRFVRTLEAPCRANRTPFMVEDLADDFIHRPQEVGQLVAALLEPAGEEPVAITAALKGAGGYGKTALARGLCHQPAIQDAFDDGILWVTLGEQPGDVQGHVVELIEVLTGERPGFRTLDAAAARLAEVIGERRMLIVVDDVWQAAHARPFLRPGENCACLITTRNSDALPADARRIDVDAMRGGEASDLLRHGLPDAEIPAVRHLARRLGGWPLLLKLANAALRRRVQEMHQPLADALAWVDTALERRGLTAFDARDAADRSQAVATTLGVSLDLLEEDERSRFAELAVFPEDAQVPLDTVAAFWARTAGLDAFDSEDLCIRLFGLSLLLDLDLRSRRVQLHDAIRAYLLDRHRAQLPALHEALVEACRARSPEGWHASPDDGYVFQHVAHHLAAAGRGDELHALVFDYRWLRAKLAVAGAHALVEDLALVENDAARHLADTLRLCAHIVGGEPSQLAGQLLGRLTPADLPGAAHLLTDAAAHAERPGLVPTRPSLSPPGGPLRATLEGHTDRVNAVAVTPDGRRSVSASDDASLRIWDLERGILHATLTGHDDAVRAVALAPDGQRAVSASDDGTLKIWDLDQAIVLATLEGHAAPISTLAVTPDGRAVSGSLDRTLKVWDLEQGSLLSTLAGHDGEVWSVATTADGRALSASNDATLKLWDLEHGTLLATLEGHDAPVWAVAATPDGRRAVSASDDTTLKVWDLEQVRLLATLQGHEASAWTVIVTQDGRHAISGSYDRTLKIWDLERAALLSTLEGHEGTVWTLTLTADGRRVLSGSYDRTARVWDLEQGTLLATLRGHAARVNDVVPAPDSRHALTASDDGTLKVWDLHRVAPQAAPRRREHAAWAIAVTPDGRRAISRSGDATFKVWDLQPPDLAMTLRGHQGTVWAAGLTPDGRRAVTGSYDRTVGVWDLEHGTLLTRLKGHGATVSAVALTADGHYAVSGSYDTTLKVWDLERGTLRATLEGHRARVDAVAVTADGPHAVSADTTTLRVWDIRRGVPLATHPTGGVGVSALALTPDGRHALGGCHDRTYRLWNLTTGHQVAMFTAETVGTCCAITSDARYATAADSYGQLHAFELLL